MRLIRTAEGYEYWIPDANEAEGNPLYSPPQEQTNVQPQLALPVELPSGDDVSDLPTFKIQDLGKLKDTRKKEEKLAEMFGVVPGPEGPLDIVKSFVSGLTAPGEVAKGEVEQGDLLSRAIDTAGLAASGGFGMTAVRGAEKNALGMVPVARAKEMPVTQATPSDILKSAVENTPGAKIDADGTLIISVSRNQHPDQELSESVRGGVFYLPKGSKDQKYYTGTNHNFAYGGRQKIEGETAYKNPLVVKGATGGKAPEAAYDSILGKGSYQKMRGEALAATPYYFKPYEKTEYVTNFLEKHAPEIAHLADYIIDNSKKGNQLSYALQEAAVASAVRKAGYDGVIGYSTKRGAEKGKPFISEVFDVRENRYPSPAGDYSVHPEYNLVPVKGNPFTLKTDTSDVGKAISVVQQAKPFFTNVEASLAKIPMKSGTAEQWINAFKRYGAGKEELQYTVGELPKGQITRAQIEQHLKDNAIQLQEHWKGELKFNKDSKYALPQVVKAAKEAGDTPGDLELVLANDGDAYRALTKKFPELSENERWAEIVAKDVFGGDTMPKGTSKYSQYQMPGGTNYRELVLTLPVKGKESKALFDFTKEMEKKYGEKFTLKWTDKEQDQYNHLYSIVEKTPNNKHYTSSHWEEPNVIAHVRMNDRTIPGVGKSLHLEEIQSDWHQAGRKQGYKVSNAQTEAWKKELDAIHEERAKLFASRDDKNRNRYEELSNREVELIDLYNKHHDALPDAPFKSNWDELALKKAIRVAVEQGYDAISWTPGKHQSTNPSKHIKSVMWSQEPDGTYWVGVKQKDGSEMPGYENRQMTKEEIRATFGKLGDEIIENKGKPIPGGPEREITGLDLDIGGTKEFYDKILVDKANKLVKQFGGKVETKSVDVGNRYNSLAHFLDWAKEKDLMYSRHQLAQFWSEGAVNPLVKQFENSKKPQEVFTIKLTPELKKQALEKGFSLFSTTPIMVPVDYDPFERKDVKLVPIAGNPFKQSIEQHRAPGGRADVVTPYSGNSPPDNDRFGPPIMDPNLPDWPLIEKKSIE